MGYTVEDTAEGQKVKKEMKEVKLREFMISDWEAAWQLWQQELGKSTDDSWGREKVESFWSATPGFPSWLWWTAALRAQ